MMLFLDARNRDQERDAMRGMFEARKQVFVDLLGWDLPVLAGRYEVDQFDNEHANYLILTDSGHHHIASARLLPTVQPGILNSIFADLCDAPPPSGSEVFEITRFCLSRDLRAHDRRLARDTLVTAIVEYALEHGIRTYTGVAENGWLQQILQFGWKCMPLGEPRRHEGMLIGALRIDIEQDTLERLAAAGILRMPAPMVTIAQAA